jgi:hypothetical protein
MDRPQRLIFLVLAIGWTLLRLVRYLRAAHTRGPGPAIPASGGMVPQLPAEAAATASALPSPIAPGGGGPRGRGMLAAAGILIAGNVVIWPLLFAIPAFAEVPTMPRLVAGVLANLILIRVASGVAERIARRSPTTANDDRNPIK